MKIPADWAQYDDEEGTFAFFDTTHWTGNLRVTPIIADNSDSLKRYIDHEYNNSPNRIKVDDFKCVSYVKRIDRGGDKQTLYFWVFGKSEFIFVCSFTIDTKNEDTSVNKKEIDKVEKIIKSIKIP